MQSDFIHGIHLYKPLVGESINPRAAQRREARREIARQEAVAARFSDPELVAARNKVREDDRRRVELLARTEGLQAKIEAASADLTKADRAKAAAEERLRSLREAERELSEMAAPPAPEPDPVEVEPSQPAEVKRGRPRKSA